MRARESRRRGRAGSASASTGRFSRACEHAYRSCSRAGLMPQTSRRRCASPPPRLSTSPPASSVRPGRRIRTRSARSSRRRATPDASRPRPTGCCEERMTIQQLNSFRTGPDERGHFGLYGGRFVAETLMPLVLELETAYAAAKNDPLFRREMDGYLKDYVGRPTPLYFAERMTEHLREASAARGGSGGAKVYLKR